MTRGQRADRVGLVPDTVEWALTRRDVEDFAERCCIAFYPNWHRYTPAYRQAKHTRWVRAIRAGLQEVRVA